MHIMTVSLISANPHSSMEITRCLFTITQVTNLSFKRSLHCYIPVILKAHVSKLAVEKKSDTNDKYMIKTVYKKIKIRIIPGAS